MVLTEACFSVLSEQMHSDPEESFFILSLTEIPVCSSGDTVDGAAEHVSYLPTTDASTQQHRFVPSFITEVSNSCL